MAGVTLYDYQLDAINRMKIGCILCGGVGSGKSRTSLAFYYKLYDGEVNTENYVRMTEPPDLYIITTARKRDTGEWDEELAHFYMSTDPEHDIYEHKVVVDSWNNIGKYVGVKNAFFIFDEQRVVGKGAWVKSFYKITQNNVDSAQRHPRGLLDGLYPGVHRQWVLPKQNGLQQPACSIQPILHEVPEDRPVS